MFDFHHNIVEIETKAKILERGYCIGFNFKMILKINPHNSPSGGQFQPFLASTITHH